MNRFAFAVLAALSFACAKPGTVVEKTPVADLGAYQSASISVDVDPSVDNPDVQKSQLSGFVEKDLKEKSLFANVVPDGGDLAIKIKIAKLDKPSLLAPETDMSGSVELFDSKAGKAVGAFDVTGSSKRNTSTSINGVNTNTGEDARKRALQAAAEQIADLIASHKGGGAK